MNLYQKTNRNCPVCLHSEYTVAINFPNLPLGDNFSISSKIAQQKPSFALDLAICENCCHVFLPNVVEPDLSYMEYYFRSASSPGLERSMEVSVNHLKSLLKRSDEITIVDIGANDGSWLSKFKNRSDNTFAVEPSPSHWSELSSRGHKVFQGYFNEESVVSIKKWLGNRKLDLVTINNTLSNIDDIQNIFKLFDRIDSGQTTFSIITGYHLDQFNSEMFDYVYHEHLSYFSIQDLHRIAKRYGYLDFQVRRFPLKGGSIQFSFSKNEPNLLNIEEMQRLISWENWIIGSPQLYANKLKRDYLHYIHKIDMNLKALAGLGKKIVGYGYSHSVSTLINVTNIHKIISRLVDDDRLRQNLFIPIQGFKIEDSSTIIPEREVVLILAWQHDKIIADKLMTNFPDIQFTNPLGSLSNINLSQ
jgi:hypothetical protein